MAVDTSFASLFRKLKLEGEEEDGAIHFPPRTWESIPSKNAPTTTTSSSSPSLPHPPILPRPSSSSLSEASLVRLALNALQGLESAVISIEKISASFCLHPADRTYHGIPSLWNRSTSTHALGKILNRIGCFGCLVFLLRKFVDNFRDLNDRDAGKEGSSPAPLYSLVNQAFAVAVGKVLEGYVCGLDTLCPSIGLRRSSKSVDVPSYFTSVVHSEVTLLEVYLHTKELRTQIEALGNVCKLHNLAHCFSKTSFEELTAKAMLEFSNFYRGGDLLTYLYGQLQIADPAHRAMLKFLFLRSCEPYCEFVRSWIYRAEISDPYKEFVVEYVDNLPPHQDVTPVDFPLASITDAVAVPCFLKDFLIPIVRAGQQLQVIKKLLELCYYLRPAEYTCEDFLPSWRGYLINHLFCSYPMTFNKGYLEAMASARNNYYERKEEEIETLLSKLEFRHQQVVPQGVSLLLTDVENMNSDDSCTKDEFDGLDASESSECSSLSGSEEQTKAEQLIEHANGLVGVGDEQRYLNSLRFSTYSSINTALQQPIQRESSLDIECKLHENSEEQVALSHFVDFSDKKRTFGHMFLADSEESNSSFIFGACIDSPTGKSQPLSLPKNPLDDDKSYSFYQRSAQCFSSLEADKTNMELLMDGLPYSSKMTSTRNGLERALGTNQLENGNCTNLFTLQPWKEANYICNFLSRNPMLRETGRFHLLTMPKEKCGTTYGKSLPYFDFSTVADPYKVSVEKFATNLPQQRESQVPLYMAAPYTNRETHDKGEQDFEGDVMIDKAGSSCILSPLHLKEHGQEASVSTDGYGGTSWETLLRSFSYAEDGSVGDHWESLSPMFEIPIDFIIDKCLVQEILLQYKYVSRLAIKLLEEGFDLQEHLLALRLYHFMESADWADLFIMSLWQHKWSVADSEQRISEIQGFLELSVQRSSCERDPNKDRLFVYIKGNGAMPPPTAAIGVHSFNFLGLGYQVDWPVSIVLTPKALKIYADIFSFLINVKLAVFSLTDVWRLLKDTIHLITRNHHSAIHEREMCHFNVLIKMRHQVNHFISTLQQYVHSQLSHISWCKFLHSLKYKVKDMMDLESVHMAYLTDSLHICFLSDETRPVAIIVESILQCAFDFRFCISSSMWDVGLDHGDLLGKLSRINLSQVLTIKQKFNKNLKQLHLCYLKSPKHGEFGLSRFWGYLNYNEYYSDIGNEMELYAL